MSNNTISSEKRTDICMCRLSLLLGKKACKCVCHESSLCAYASILYVGQGPTKGKMSELIFLKCSALSLFHSSLLQFYLWKKNQECFLLSVSFGREGKRDRRTHPLSRSLLLFYHPLSLSSSPHSNLTQATLNHSIESSTTPPSMPLFFPRVACV